MKRDIDYLRDAVASHLGFLEKQGCQWTEDRDGYPIMSLQCPQFQVRVFFDKARLAIQIGSLDVGKLLFDLSQICRVIEPHIDFEFAMFDDGEVFLTKLDEEMRRAVPVLQHILSRIADGTISKWTLIHQQIMQK